MSTLQPENFYFTTTTSTVSSLTTDGSFTVSSAPSGVRGWLILSYDDESKREVIKYYNVSGSTIYYRGIDRPSPKEHVTGSKVMMADSAEHMKYFEGLIGDTFYLEKISALVVKCWGGKVRIAGVEYDISDQASLAITDDDDTYVYLDLDDQTLKVTTTLATAQSGVLLHTVTASSGAITSIVNHTTKDYFYDHTHDDRYYTETESDANFAAIGHNHNLADLAEKNYSSLDSRPEDDDFHTLTEELSAAADDDEILIWDTSASAYKRIAKNLVVPEVNDDDFYQNLDEELNNAADDDYVLIWDTSASAYKKIAKVRITPPGSVSTPWTTNGLNIYFNTGNIGLGVSSPTEKIDVDGNIKATGTVECDDPTVDEHAATKLYVDGKAEKLHYKRRGSSRSDYQSRRGWRTWRNSTSSGYEGGDGAGGGGGEGVGTTSGGAGAVSRRRWGRRITRRFFWNTWVKPGQGDEAAVAMQLVALQEEAAAEQLAETHGYGGAGGGSFSDAGDNGTAERRISVCEIGGGGGRAGVDRQPQEQGFPVFGRERHWLDILRIARNDKNWSGVKWRSRRHAGGSCFRLNRLWRRWRWRWSWRRRYQTLMEI
jgi:hypothetical protein